MCIRQKYHKENEIKNRKEDFLKIHDGGGGERGMYGFPHLSIKSLLFLPRGGQKYSFMVSSLTARFFFSVGDVVR